MIYIINQNEQKFIILLNALYLLFFKRDIIEEYLSQKDLDDEQSNVANKLDSIVNPIEDGGREKKGPPTSISPVTSIKVGVSPPPPPNFLNFSFNLFDRLV